MLSLIFSNIGQSVEKISNNIDFSETKIIKKEN